MFLPQGGGRHNRSRTTEGCIPVSQKGPLNVGAQIHRKSLTRSRHVPPFEHWMSTQSSIFISHRSPSKPGGHEQLSKNSSSKVRHKNVLDLSRSCFFSVIDRNVFLNDRENIRSFWSECLKT